MVSRQAIPRSRAAHTEKAALRLEILRDLGAEEGIHLIDHPDGGVEDRVGADGAGSFAEPQAEVEKRPGAHRFEHLLVAGLVAAVTENGII